MNIKRIFTCCILYALLIIISCFIGYKIWGSGCDHSEAWLLGCITGFIGMMTLNRIDR